jgi:hypothetical protein
LHARTPYTVLLRLEPTHLVVEVVDSSHRLPKGRNYAVDASTGRGIKIIDSFSATWGATPTPDGKIVWAHVRPDEPNMLTYVAADPEPAVAADVDDSADRPADPSPPRGDTQLFDAINPLKAFA